MNTTHNRTIERRMRGNQLLLDGCNAIEVARLLGVTRQTAHRWQLELNISDFERLNTFAKIGRPARLDEAQRAALIEELLKSAKAHGFETRFWTLNRVGLLINKMFAVEYSQTQVWNIMRALGFQVQKPQHGVDYKSDELLGWTRTDLAPNIRTSASEQRHSLNVTVDATKGTRKSRSRT